MIGIYKITSPSNKIYIGQSVNLTNRFYKYKHNDCKKQFKLYNSFKKYGYKNHKIEIIEKCNIEELTNKEGYWQDYYDSVNKGLNCKRVTTLDKTGYLSEETKNKISKANKGRVFSEKVLYNIREKRKNRIVSNETKLKQSNSAINRFKNETEEEKNKRINSIKLNNTKSKKVIDLSNNKIYSSCTEAAQFLGLNKKSLSKKLNGTRKNNTNLIYLDNAKCS